MKIIKISLLALSLLTIAANANAQYLVIYGSKQITGENITFINKGKWVKADSIISDWTNSGSPTNCTAWTPDVSTVDAGISVEQSANCTQVQTRTVQEREQNNYTLEYRNVGDNKTENQTLTNHVIKRTSVGTKITSECGNGDINSYRWVNGTPNMRMMYIIWNGTKVFPDIGDITLTEYTYGEYKYTKGTLKANYGYYTFNTVCRTKI